MDLALDYTLTEKRCTGVHDRGINSGLLRAVL